MNEKSSGSRSRKQRLTAVGTRCADHVTPLYPQKLAQTSLTGGGRSVGIVRVRTKATESFIRLFTAQLEAVQSVASCRRRRNVTVRAENLICKQTRFVLRDLKFSGSCCSKLLSSRIRIHVEGSEATTFRGILCLHLHTSTSSRRLFDSEDECFTSHRNLISYSLIEMK